MVLLQAACLALRRVITSHVVSRLGAYSRTLSAMASSVFMQTEDAVERFNMPGTASLSEERLRMQRTLL